MPCPVAGRLTCSTSQCPRCPGSSRNRDDQPPRSAAPDFATLATVRRSRRSGGTRSRAKAVVHRTAPPGPGARGPAARPARREASVACGSVRNTAPSGARSAGKCASKKPLPRIIQPAKDGDKTSALSDIPERQLRKPEGREAAIPTGRCSCQLMVIDDHSSTTISGHSRLGFCQGCWTPTTMWAACFGASGQSSFRRCHAAFW